MCFNSEVSLATYFTGLSGCVVLYKMNKIPESLFFGWVVQMQLVDHFLWKNSDRLEKRKEIEKIELEKCKNKIICNNNQINKCNETNKIVSKVGLFINHMEPFVLWGGINYFSKIKLPIAVNIIMYIFFILTIIYSIQIVLDKEAECTMETEESSPHLHWKWNYGKYYQLYYFLFVSVVVILSIFGLENGHILANILALGFGASFLVYETTHSVGNMWCFAAAFCPWLLAGLYK